MWRREGLSVLTREDRVPLRYFRGAEVPVARGPVPRPFPLGPRRIVCRRTVEVLAGLPHEGRGLVGEVPVLWNQGPVREEVPEDLVGLCPACLPQMDQEHEVLLGLLVQFEVQEDVAPESEGLSVTTALDDAPIGREALPDKLEELVLEVPEVRVARVLEEPEGPVFVGPTLRPWIGRRHPSGRRRVWGRRWPVPVRGVRSWRTCGEGLAAAPGATVPGAHAGGLGRSGEEGP